MKKLTTKTPDEATLRPSYRKLKDAHERSLAANREMGASVEDVRRLEQPPEHNKPYVESPSSSNVDNASEKLQVEWSVDSTVKS